jgi:hypothetical protein
VPPAQIGLFPAFSKSSAALTLTASAAASGQIGMFVEVSRPAPSEIHPHEWPIATPMDAFFGTLLAGGVAAMALRGRFGFFRSIDDGTPP